MFVQVIVDSKHPQVDHVFDYRVPAAFTQTICVGLRVLVPFGRRNTKKEGYVIGISEHTDVPQNKIKEVWEVLDDGKPVFTPTTLALAEWMKQTYFCTLSQCLQAMMPPGIRTKSVWYAQALTKEEEVVTEEEERFWNELQEHGGSMSCAELERQWGVRTQYLLKTLQEKGLLFLRQEIQKSTYRKEQRLLALTQDRQCLEEVWEKARCTSRLAGQCRVLEVLEAEGTLTWEELREAAAVSDSPIQTLLKKGVVQQTRQERKRDVFRVEDFMPTMPFLPTVPQAKVLKMLREELQKEEKRPVLLHGVTGSGKTEIYMQLIQDVLHQGKQAIVLVPEISLTPQIMQRLISRFGRQVSVTHSRLSVGERLDQWKKARDGEISIMLGPRSALFAPFSKIGLIVMDESHESSYDSDSTPKYHTREVAKKLAELTGAMLIMGSATPDLVSYHRALQGEYLLLELKERTNGSRLPHMQVVDMRRELEEGNRSAFSRELQAAVAENLENGQQTMLFLNRRGYATFVSCRACGMALLCPDCNISYTYHAREAAMICHYCGRQAPVPQVCPSCGSRYIRFFGTGTQKIEEETKKLFPKARVLRMDWDTTTEKNSHARILERFSKGNADILVGTQMIAKGHDFPNVTLVGIMAADISLHAGSYIAAENCFQLITQAAGRAGRGALPGRVFIQTYQPENHAIRMAAEQDYHGFYEEEILLRQAMDYPPFTNIFSVLLTGEQEEEVIRTAQRLGRVLQYYQQRAGCSVLGPSPAALPKFRGEYRWRLFVKGKDEERLKRFVLYAVDKVQKDSGRKIQFHLAFNPQNLV